jgi:hypothetical protein
MKPYPTWHFILALGLTGLLTGQQVHADPPPWAPAHGQRAKQHPYTYYPEYGIYYGPESRMWFWLEGSSWRIGATLPVDYRPYTTGGVSIELGTERPYEEHNLVVDQYGKPKKMKHRNKGK